jgi:hypothetical protein
VLTLALAGPFTKIADVPTSDEKKGSIDLAFPTAPQTGFNARSFAERAHLAAVARRTLAGCAILAP